MTATFAYLKARVLEKSTWAEILTAIASAALLPKPWCYVFTALAAIKALVPDGPVK